jgi:hypothetical protein
MCLDFFSVAYSVERHDGKILSEAMDMCFCELKEQIKNESDYKDFKEDVNASFEKFSRIYAKSESSKKDKLSLLATAASREIFRSDSDKSTFNIMLAGIETYMSVRH